MVRPISRQGRRQWRSLVDQFHYLGAQVIIGEHLLYQVTDFSLVDQGFSTKLTTPRRNEVTTLFSN